MPSNISPIESVYPLFLILYGKLILIAVAIVVTLICAIFMIVRYRQTNNQQVKSPDFS